MLGSPGGHGGNEREVLADGSVLKTDIIDS